MPLAVCSPCLCNAALPVPLEYVSLAGTEHLDGVLCAVPSAAGSQDHHLLHRTLKQLRVSSLQDTAGIKRLSCEFLGQFSSFWKVDKLSVIN